MGMMIFDVKQAGYYLKLGGISARIAFSYAFLYMSIFR